MKRLNWIGLAAAMAAAFALAACAGGGSSRTARDIAEADSDYQNTLMEQLVLAEPGAVIEIPEGVFAFDRSLNLNVDGVTIRGAGMDRTILTFAGQVAGAEGLLVQASDFTIEDLAIEDTRGDALKISDGTNVTIRRVRVEWTGPPRTENGAYGMYPVQCENVLVEDSVAIGASDAGIYVGQSRNVIVRRNRAEWNVAGIEIENTQDADVYENVATNNTGGILVFNMPNLPQPGAGTRVFNNEVFENNTDNFGHPGTPVASVPAGSGVVVNSNDDVEIFNNRIADNRTANIIISSVFSAGFGDGEFEDDFDPYPERIHVHDNALSGGGGWPDDRDLQLLRIARFGPWGRLPDIIWDGFVNDEVSDEERGICVNEEDADLLNADGPNGYDRPRVRTEEHRCSLAPLPAVEDWTG